MTTMRLILLSAAAMAALVARAGAQDAPYKLEDINFDLWCQEEQHLPPERCDKRLPQDDADYEAYVAKIEKYEVPYLQHKQEELDFSRTIIHNDPIDRPTETSVPQNDQPPPQ